MSEPRGRIVLVAGGAAQPLLAAAEAFGLSPLQQRVVAAVVRSGSVRHAADALGLSYATARETMAGAAKRMMLPKSAVVQAGSRSQLQILPGDARPGLRPYRDARHNPPPGAHRAADLGRVFARGGARARSRSARRW